MIGECDADAREVGDGKGFRARHGKVPGFQNRPPRARSEAVENHPCRPLLRVRDAAHLSGLGDGDGLGGLVAPALWHILHQGHNVHSLEDVAENDVLAVQPRCLDGADEELDGVSL